MSITPPKLETKAGQPCLSIRIVSKMEELCVNLPPLFPEAIGWVFGNGLSMEGAPFVRYNAFRADGLIEVEVGVPVDRPYEGNERMIPTQIPAGTYATTMYTGLVSGIMDATAALLKWAEEEKVTWAVDNVEGKEVWAGRFEFYWTNPEEEPDPAKWETEIAILTRDA